MYGPISTTWICKDAFVTSLMMTSVLYSMKSVGLVMVGVVRTENGA